MENGFDKLVDNLMNDETWEVPKEDREMMLMGLEWTLLDL